MTPAEFLLGTFVLSGAAAQYISLILVLSFVGQDFK